MPVPACAVLLGAIAYHAAPYVPEALERLQGFFEGPIARVSDLEKLPELYRAQDAKPLFARIEDEEQLSCAGSRTATHRGSEEHRPGSRNGLRRTHLLQQFSN